MSGKIVTLSPKAIIVAGLQIREEMDRKHVDDLAELFDEDTPTWPEGLPPAVVFHDGNSYYLADGHHRLTAAEQSGCTEIRVEVHKGTMQDALRHACGANAKHGLKRTNADKRKALRIAIENNLAGSEAGLAKICNVSRPLVSDFLRELGKKESAKPKEKAGKAAGGCSSACPDNGGSKLSESESDATNGGGGLSNDESEDGRNEGESDPAVPVNSPPVSEYWLLPCQGRLDRLDSILREAAIILNELGNLRGGELLRSHYLKLKDGERLYSADLENLRRELKHWRPHSPRCPVCNGTPSQHCNLCFGLPYLTRGAYDRLTDEQRAKLEKGSTNDAA